VVDPSSRPSIVFVGTRRVARGPLAETALVVKAAASSGAEPAIVFDETTGNVVDLDLRGSSEEILRRLGDPSSTQAPAADPTTARRRGRGRPKLGVVSREVTLLPRHWEWLGAQPGGASQALRRLVDEARRGDRGTTQRRAAREAAYRFMSAMAGNLPGFEEATRALFADDRERFREHTAGWPEDVRRFAEERGFNAPETDGT